MCETEKTHNVTLAMVRQNFKIMGISEARCIYCRQSKLKDKISYYSGSKDGQHRHGVAIILDETLQMS